jgi:hypothetical protein
LELGCQIFHGTIYKNGKKSPQNIPDCPNIFQITTKYTASIETGQNFPFQGLPKYTKVWIFGMKSYHLAALV